VKALDTPVLLEILRGSPRARRWVRELGAEEIATTELNLWELAVLAIEDPSRGLDQRLTALDRLRRKLLVFPMDVRAMQSAVRLRQRRRRVPTSLAELIVGTLEAHGVSEWVTVDGAWSGDPPAGLRVVRFGSRVSN
jgi:predicted nucleic acid-binding protein